MGDEWVRLETIMEDEYRVLLGYNLPENKIYFPEEKVIDFEPEPFVLRERYGC